MPETAALDVPAPADVLLADGSIVVIRPLRPEDGPALHELHERVSDEAIRMRFFSVARHAAHAYVDHVLDDPETLALVADRHGRLIGLATAEPMSPTRSEVSFLVADDARGQGVGDALARASGGPGADLGDHGARGRRAHREPRNADRLLGRRLHRQTQLRHRHRAADPRDRSDPGGDRTLGLPGVPSRGPVLAADAAALLRGRGRRPLRRDGDRGHRAPLDRQRRVPGSRGGHSPPGRRAGRRADVRHPARPDRGPRPGRHLRPRRAGAGRVPRRGLGRRPGRGHRLVGVRRARRGRRPDPARSRDPGSGPRRAPGRAELPGPPVQPPGRTPQRHVPRGRAARRWSGRRQPVRRCRHRPHGPRSRARPRRPHLRLTWQQGRRVQQRPAGGLVRRPRSDRSCALPRVVRQLREVRAVRATLRPSASRCSQLSAAGPPAAAGRVPHTPRQRPHRGRGRRALRAGRRDRVP